MVRICRVGAWLIVAVVAGGSAEPAHAEPAAAMAWHAPPSCPTAAEVRARIERRLGAPIDRAMHGIEVEVAQAGEAGFVARIDLRSVTMANEVRVLTSARCDELTDAVAVVIARVAAEARAPEVEPRGERERPIPATRPSETHDWGGGVRALGLSGIGALPGVGVAGELAGYARHRSLSAEVAATRWLRGADMPAAHGASAMSVGLDVIALRIGWRPEDAPLRGWLTGELGSVAGDGAPAGSQAGGGRWAGLGGGFGVAWPMTRTARLVGVIEAVVPLERTQFLRQGGIELYRPDVVSVRSGLGLEIGWP